jgi:hypothetical protein
MKYCPNQCLSFLMSCWWKILENRRALIEVSLFWYFILESGSPKHRWKYVLLICVSIYMKESGYFLIHLYLVFDWYTSTRTFRREDGQGHTETPFQAGNMVFPGLSGDIMFLYYILINDMMRHILMKLNGYFHFPYFHCNFFFIFSQQWNIFSVFSPVSCQTSFCYIQPN